MFGYSSCMDYYRDASPGKKLPNTAVPILCLNAADDPFSPQTGEYTTGEVCQYKHCKGEITAVMVYS